MLDDVEFGVAGGRVRGRVNLVLAAAAPPRVDVFVDAKSVSIETLDAAFAGGGHFRGGRLDLSANLAMAGTTPKQLAASANGSVLLAAADATLAGGAGAALDRNVLMTMLKLLVPKGSRDQALVVQCAVLRLPLRRGVASIDRSIAAETREVAVVASGVIDLVDQTLKLELKPSVKKGLGLNPASLADLVEVSGPLQNPQVGVGAKGAVRGATKVGVGVATGGLSLLVPSVVGATKDVSACVQAAPPAAAQAARPATPKPGEKPAGKPRARSKPPG